jgi:hypothetical protein
LPRYAAAVALDGAGIRRETSVHVMGEAVAVKQSTQNKNSTETKKARWRITAKSLGDTAKGKGSAETEQLLTLNANAPAR